MKNFKKVILIVLMLILAILSIVLYLRQREDKKYEECGNVLINKIESFKKQKGYFPFSVSDLGINEEMGEGPYYAKMDSITYIVYFNIGFDNTKTYYSKLKKWQYK